MWHDISKRDDSCKSLSHLGQRTHIISYLHYFACGTFARKKTSLLSYWKNFFSRKLAHKQDRFPLEKNIKEILAISWCVSVYSINFIRDIKSMVNVKGKTSACVAERNAWKCIEMIKMRAHIQVFYFKFKFVALIEKEHSVSTYSSFFKYITVLSDSHWYLNRNIALLGHIIHYTHMLAILRFNRKCQ